MSGATVKPFQGSPLYNSGLMLALLSILFGFTMGGIFGGMEDRLKGNLRASGEAVLEPIYGSDEAKLEKTLEKSWAYMQRAHLHGGAIGTTALTLVVLLGLLGRTTGVGAVSAFFLGFGALGYSSFWLFAGLRAPGLGGTGPAKESLQWLGVPTSAMCILGLVSVLVIVARHVFFHLGSTAGKS